MTPQEGSTFTQTSGQHRKFLMIKRKPSLCPFLSSLFSPFLSFPVDPHIPSLGCKDWVGSASKPMNFLVGTFWRTSWKADGSVLSGQPPDGKHTDLQKVLHALSFSRLQELPVVLSLSQTPFANFVLYLFPTRDTYFTVYMCFPPFKTIFTANSVQQSGFAPKVQGSSGWFLQFITNFDLTGKPETSIPLQYMN